MSQLTTLPPAASLALSATVPSRPLDTLLATSAEAFRGVFNPYGDDRNAATLERAVSEAERFMARYATAAADLHDAVKLETLDAIGRQLNAFVAAWPNASRADLAGYGLQLADDVIERRPCRYALRAALRHLRQTSRFLPSIAEVLAELDESQVRIRNTAFHVEQIPAALERARSDLLAARKEAR